jgi:hypothetical protein
LKCRLLVKFVSPFFPSFVLYLFLFFDNFCSSWQKLVCSDWFSTIKQKLLSRFHNSSFIAVPFLNLMSNLEERSGGVVIRLGGNTQEYASMVDSLPKGASFSKASFNSNQTVSSTFHSLYLLESVFTIFFLFLFYRHRHRLFCIRSICFIWLLISLRCSMLNGFWVCFIFALPSSSLS